MRRWILVESRELKVAAAEIWRPDWVVETVGARESPAMVVVTLLRQSKRWRVLPLPLLVMEMVERLLSSSWRVSPGAQMQEVYGHCGRYVHDGRQGPYRSTVSIYSAFWTSEMSHFLENWQ